MRQRLFALAKEYNIKDGDGRDVAVVRGRLLSLGDKLTFLDMAGNELVFISQRLLAWGPTYEIYRGGQLTAVMKRHLFTLLRASFTLDLPGSDDLQAEGDLLNHEYVFTCAGTVVARVSKEWFTLADTYGVDVAPDQDVVLILAATVVIDLVCHTPHPSGVTSRPGPH